jgi:hypothetical protein
MIDLYDCEEKKMACGSCPRYENMENPKAGFPHFHSALENWRPQKAPPPVFHSFHKALLLVSLFLLFEKGAIPEPWVGETKVLIVVEENNS